MKHLTTILLLVAAALALAAPPPSAVYLLTLAKGAAGGGDLPVRIVTALGAVTEGRAGDDDADVAGVTVDATGLRGDVKVGADLWTLDATIQGENVTGKWRGAVGGVALNGTLTGTWAAVAAEPPAATPAAQPVGEKAQAWIVQFPAPAAGLVDLHILIAERKAVAGFALETDRSPHWDADVTGLTVADDRRLEGEVKLTRRSDTTAVGTQQGAAAVASTLTLTVAAKEGRLSGTVARAAADTSTTGLLGRAPAPVAVHGRVMPATVGDAMIELMPAGISSTGAVAKKLADVGSIDGFLLRLHLSRGTVTKAELILCTGPHDSVVAPEQAVTMEGCALTGSRLTGALNLSAEGLQGRLTLDGVVIGSHAAGTATWASRGGDPIRTGFRAWVSRAKGQAPAQTGERTWSAQGVALEADAKLATQAAQEALAPLRPGVPGQQPFYSTKLVHLGNYTAIYAPTLAFAEVAGAVRYRITARQGALPGKKPGWSFEADKPWAPLTPVWGQVPLGSVVVSAVGLDAAGKEIGPAMLPETNYGYIGGNPSEVDKHWAQRTRGIKQDGRTYPARAEIQLTKVSAFTGPYWTSQRSPREAALAAARFGRDVLTRMKCCRGTTGLGNYNTGDGGFAMSLAGFAIDCCQVARWTDDPLERDEALALAERIAWRVHLDHRGRLPVVYKGVVPNVQPFMRAYLDLYTLTRDERFREAALDLGRTLAKVQQDNGGFLTSSGHWPGGTFGPSEYRWAGSEVALRFFGELRRTFSTTEFVEAEKRALSWVQTYALPAMTWQNTGTHSQEMILVQDAVPAFATDYLIWLLDFAEGPQRDLAQAAEVARWAEERSVTWAHRTKGDQTAPFCSGWGRAAGTGVKTVGRLAYAFARLSQETGDPLWKAKAEALLQGLMAAQDPVTGTIPLTGERTQKGAIKGHPDIGIAAEALALVPRLLTTETKGSTP